jgi:uncharacterized protein (TIGR02466 family)
MTDAPAGANLIPLFPTGILVAEMPELDNAALARSIRALQAAERGEHGLIAGDGVSTYGGARDLHRRPEFKPFVDAVTPRLTGFARALGADLEHSELLMIDCWSNIQQPGSQVLLHRHPNSLISAAYYVEAPANCGRIQFSTPLEPYRMSDFPRFATQTAFNAKRYSVDPAPGRLVLFPSWLAHQTEPNRSNGERIVISFNVAARVTAGKA